MAGREMTFGRTLFASCLGTILGAIVIGGLSVLILLIAVISSLQQNEPDIPDQGILEIGSGANQIVERSEGGVFGMDGGVEFLRMLQAVRSAAIDDRIRGILVRVSGISGGPAQLAELRQELVRFKGSGKFVVASINDGLVSEWPYYLATVADTIFMHPMGVLEINGFATTVPYFKTAMDRLGIRAEVFKVGRYKSAVEPFLLDSASDDAQENLESLLTDAINRFRSAVAVGRRLRVDQIDRILDSVVVLRSEDALREKLIDVVAYDDEFDGAMRRRLSLDSTSKVPYVDLKKYMSEREEETALGTHQVAIVYVVGAIVDGESGYNPDPLFGGGVVGSETFAEAMQEARASEAVRCVVVRIESPGGMMTASDVMWREIKLTTHVKPVIVSMGNIATSGGYYIAAAADSIVADSGTLTGSIGVFGLFLNTSELMRETLGIGLDVMRTHPHADFMSGSRDMTASVRAILQRMVDSSYSRFLDVVAQARRMSRDSVHARAQGRVWTGAQAHEIGLVDELGGFDRALTIARQRAGIPEADVSYRLLPRPRGFLEQFIEQMGRAGSIMSNQVETPSEIVIRQLEQLRQWSGVQFRGPTVVIR